jgi:RHS repeat-associated protein
VSDSDPSLELFIGYAGGLADPVTGLVRFGWRDYGVAAGRWTAHDPTLFDGDQDNLYIYVRNDPVNQRDPLGLFCIGGSLSSKPDQAATGSAVASAGTASGCLTSSS